MKIAMKLVKYSHPLTDQQPGLYNICNGQVASDTVNVQDALAIEGEQSRHLSTSLSSKFYYCTIKKEIKTIESLKKTVTVTGNAIYDVETLSRGSIG